MFVFPTSPRIRGDARDATCSDAPRAPSADAGAGHDRRGARPAAGTRPLRCDGRPGGALVAGATCAPWTFYVLDLFQGGRESREEGGGRVSCRATSYWGTCWTGSLGRRHELLLAVTKKSYQGILLVVSRQAGKYLGAAPSCSVVCGGE